VVVCSTCGQIISKRARQAIGTCGTYLLRFSFSARFAFFYKSSVAANVIGIFLAVLLSVLCAASIDFLLMRVEALKIIWMQQSPALIILEFLFLSALLTTASFLPFFKARVPHKQPTTKRASLPLCHKDSSPALQIVDNPLMREFEEYGIDVEKENKRK
jgi:hypothetical protein